MEITQESVKAWLAKYPERDRNWLADQCGVSKNTVNNWLSTATGIPSKAVLIIENLMRADAESEPAAPLEAVNLPATCTPDQFNLYTRAYKHSECEQFHDWITTRLDAAAEEELGLSSEDADHLPATGKMVAFELPCPGALAAGMGTTGDDLDTVSVSKEYPQGYFAMRIIGDSMDNGQSDAIPDGSIAVFKPMKNGGYAANGGIYAFATPNGDVIKKFSRKNGGELVSLNPAYPPIPYDEEMKVCGEFVTVEVLP